MQFIQVRDIKIYYELAGSGPRLIYFAGRGGDLRQEGSPMTWPIAQHFKVLAFDQRGTGQTDKPDRSYTMAEYADDAAALMDALGWDRANVLGVSFGGMVAQEFALGHPERVERVALCCSSSGGAGGSSYPLHEIWHLPQDERLRNHLPIGDNRRDAAWQAANPEEAQRIIDGMKARENIGADEPGHEAGAWRQLEARARHDTFDRLPGLKLPVFIAGGKYDLQARPQNQEALHSQIPGSRLEFFDGGHGFINEDPRAQERIRAFLHGELDE